ncbi:hypothetical protein BZA70DRAFT_281652 [Myxozyma melibiosi]|uniref:Uncharacterized protein n=1 Tax=Myxozyma melibiosi TaxID=54550 RepID=A0ABR1F2U9_9ASCO
MQQQQQQLSTSELFAGTQMALHEDSCLGLTSASSTTSLVGLPGARRHHHGAHGLPTSSSSTLSLYALPRTMSGFDINSLPESEQMSHLVSTLRKSLRRSSEIRREIQKLRFEYGKAEEPTQEVTAHYEESKRKLEIDLHRTEAFVKRYTAAISHLSGMCSQAPSLLSGPSTDHYSTQTFRAKTSLKSISHPRRRRPPRPHLQRSTRARRPGVRCLSCYKQFCGIPWNGFVGFVFGPGMFLFIEYLFGSGRWFVYIYAVSLSLCIITGVVFCVFCLCLDQCSTYLSVDY